MFSNNRAGSEGGVLYAPLGSYVNLYDEVHFFNNSCSSMNSQGGAISLHGASVLSLLGETSFVGNSAGNHTLDGQGGAISLNGGSVILLAGETSFIENSANSGGAIYSSASAITLGKNTTVFSGNTAGQGSALRLESLSLRSITIHPSNTTYIAFLRNNCTKRGGTVSWIKDPSSGLDVAFSAQTIPHFKRFNWESNTAVFGNVSSTQAISLSASEKITSVSAYYSELLSYPSISLLDYYAAQDLSDSSSVVTASVVRSSCINHVIIHIYM